MAGAAADKDNEMKERLGRILFASGLMVRFNVQVVAGHVGKTYETGGADQFTDVDVMALGHDQLLHRRSIIGDCKGGRSGRPRERIYWLAGLRQRIGADEAFFAKADLAEPGPFIEDYRRLGLSIVNRETLARMEVLVRANSLAGKGPVSDGSVARWDSEIGRLKDVDRRLHSYMEYGYWYDSPGAKVDNLLKVIQVCSGRKELAFVVFAALGMLAAAILDIVAHCVLASDKQRERAIRGFIAGDRSLNEQERLLTAMHEFFREEFKKRTNRNWGVGKETFLTFLTPPYLDSLVDLVERWLKNPAAHVLPRILDALAFKHLGDELTPVLGVVVKSNESRRDAHRAIGDLLAFVQRADSIDAGVHGDLTKAAKAIDV